MPKKLQSPEIACFKCLFCFLSTQIEAVFASTTSRHIFNDGVPSDHMTHVLVLWSPMPLKWHYVRQYLKSPFVWLSTWQEAEISSMRANITPVGTVVCGMSEKIAVWLICSEEQPSYLISECLSISFLTSLHLKWSSIWNSRSRYGQRWSVAPQASLQPRTLFLTAGCDGLCNYWESYPIYNILQWRWVKYWGPE